MFSRTGISDEEINEFLYKHLVVDKDKSITMRIVFDKFKTKFRIKEIDKELKAYLRKMASNIIEEENICVNGERRQFNQTTFKRKRKEPKKDNLNEDVEKKKKKICISTDDNSSKEEIRRNGFNENDADEVAKSSLEDSHTCNGNDESGNGKKGSDDENERSSSENEGSRDESEGSGDKNEGSGDENEGSGDENEGSGDENNDDDSEFEMVLKTNKTKQKISAKNGLSDVVMNDGSNSEEEKSQYCSSDEDKTLSTLKKKLKNYENSLETGRHNNADIGKDIELNNENGSSPTQGKKKGKKKNGDKHLSFKQTNKDSIETVRNGFCSSKNSECSESSYEEDPTLEGDKKKKKYKSSNVQNSLSYQKEEDDSTKLKKLKRYLRQCGTRLNYQKFFSDCRSMKGKERKLETYIKELTDIEGRITLEKCKKYKLKKEKEDEMAELDVSKIITSSVKGKRVTRQSSINNNISKSSSSACDKMFNNMRDLLDSDESDNEKRPRKNIAIVSDEDE